MSGANASTAEDDTVWPNSLLQPENSLLDVINVIWYVLSTDKVHSLPVYHGRKLKIEAA